MGAIDGGATAQNVAAQTGGTSIELLHNGCTCPSTQRQTHEARASAVRPKAMAAPRNQRTAPSPIQANQARARKYDRRMSQPGAIRLAQGHAPKL
jgi:hypothetical protein